MSSALHKRREAIHLNAGQPHTPGARLLRVLHSIENGFLLLLIFSAVSIATLQIVLRNSGADALVWADQALNILVLWIAMAGALVATREKNHIAIDLVGRYLSGWPKRLVVAVTFSATAICCAIASWFGVGFVLEEKEYGDIAFLDVPLWLCEAIIPFALGIIAIRYTLFTVQALLGMDFSSNEESR